MSWHRIWLVARREYTFNFKRPSFLFTAFGVPLLSLVAMFLIFRFSMNRETNLNNWQRVGYIDRAGIVLPDAPNPDHYTAIPVSDQPSASSSSLKGILKEQQDLATQQLVDKQLDAYFVIDPDYVLTGRVDVYARKTIPRALHDNITSFLRDQIAAHAPGDLPVPMERLSDMTFTLRDVASGKELSDTALVGRLLLPFIFVLLYFMATSTTAQFLMSGVVEEKENRLMEILATSLRPQELLWGKLLGLGALSLTQIVLWAGGGLLIVAINQDAQTFIGGARFQPGDIALIAVLFVINFLVFSAIMLGIGASVTAEAESRQIAGVFTFVNVLPIALLSVFFNNPNGPLPLFFTFFPLTAATGLILRLGLTGLPAWQIGASLAVQVISVVVVMWLAAKVFRLGMLMYGKSLSPRTLLTALREGHTTLTTASTEYTPRAARSQRRRRGLFR
jgi:ABC-2 type transport system permease protein